MNATAVGRADLDLDKLLLLDIKALVLRHVKFVEFDGDEFVNRIVRQTLAEERQGHQRRYLHRKPSPYLELYRASLKHRARYYAERQGSDTAQVFKAMHSKRAKRLRVYDPMAVITPYTVILS
jgi:hypothetical protein